MAKTKNKKDVQESLDFIIEHMLTKDDVREIVRKETAHMATKSDVREIVRGELSDIRSEHKDIRKRLEVLEERSRNHAGFSKEVDHVPQRVIAIEKHLGIKA